MSEHKNFASNLRALADWYEAHPEIEVPYSISIYQSVETKDELAKYARAMGTGDKYADDSCYGLQKTFGSKLAKGYILIDAYASREQVCERKVVGVRKIPRKVEKARKEEIVEWVCPPSLLSNVHPLDEVEG